MSFFLDNVRNKFIISVISTNHWLVRVATTSMDQLGIGMPFTDDYLPLVIVIFTILLLLVCVVILGFFFSQLKKMRASWDLNSQQTQEFECEVTNMPFFLFFIWIGATFASTCSFVLGYNILENVLENQIPFENLVEGQNQIHFSTGILIDSDTFVVGQTEVYEVQGVAESKTLNVELYKSHLNILANNKLQEECNLRFGYYNYKLDKTNTFGEECFRISQTASCDGYNAVVDQLTEYFGHEIDRRKTEFKGYRVKYIYRGTMSEIADQKLEILLKYGEDCIAHATQNRIELTQWAEDRLRNVVTDNARDDIIEYLSTQFETEFFKIYKTSVEMTVFFDNFFEIHGQKAGTPVQEAGTPVPRANTDIHTIKLTVQRNKSLYDDGVSCPKE